MHNYVPRSKNKSVVVREAIASFKCIDDECLIEKMTLDTGASSGNYIGRKFIENNFKNVIYDPCDHIVRLGDGKSIMRIKNMVTLEISLLDNYGNRTKPITTEFYVSDSLGNEAIIGLPDLLGNYFDYFARILNGAVKNRPLQYNERVLCDLNQICDEFEEELYNRIPNMRRIKKLVTKARKKLDSYERTKKLVKDDPYMVKVYQKANPEETPEPAEEKVVFLVSHKHGVVYDDDRIENIVASIEVCSDHYLPGELLHPWSEPPQICEEEVSTPDPLSFSEDILKFMEMPVEESRKEYFEMIPGHVGEEMKKMCPEIMDRLREDDCVETFAPSSWNGIKVEPATLTTIGTLPKEMQVRARPIRKELYSHAKKEFDRLSAYFYEPSNSSIASPLVIAPKATAPFIRFCGDYREINKFIKIPQQPIPIVNMN